jgi:PAS domain S-box-containing protein
MPIDPSRADAAGRAPSADDAAMRFQELADAAPVLMWVADTTHATTWFNKPWYAFTGRTPADELGDGWLQGVHPADRDRCLATYLDAFDRREAFRIDYRLRRADGQWRTVDDNGAPRFDGEGRFLGYIGSCLDVTEHRATEDTLRAREELLRLATEAAEVGLWDVDPVTDALFWPPRVKAMFGISADVPVTLADFYAGLHPQDHDATVAAFAAAADPARRALYDVEYRTVGKEDGLVRHVAARGRGLFDDEGRCVRLIGTVIDITQRKLAAQRLRQSEAHLAETVATLDSLIASAPIGFAVLDLSHRFVRVNAIVAEINGLPVEAHVGRSMDEVHPGNAVTVVPLLEQVARTGQPITSLEIEGRASADPSTPRYWLTSLFPVAGADGRVAFVGVTAVDITARRCAESAVRELNETLEAKVAARTAERDRVWRNSRDLLVVIGADGRFRAVSPSWTSILGHAPQDVVGRHFSEFVWPEDAEFTTSGLANAAAGSDLTNFENRYCRKDGTPRWISWRTSVEEGLVFAYGRDIDAEKQKDLALARAEEALRQSQKMEAIGRLTGGIAHDFNNLLQAVSGNLQLIRRVPGDAQRVRQWVESALKGVDRGAKLTSQLLAFSRSQELALKPVVLSALVAPMHELLTRTLGPAVRLRFDLDSEGLTVLGDETQLEMAVLNLAINARDAMPDGGELVIATRLRRDGSEGALIGSDAVALTVTDTGVGMSAEVCARAFEPFFTTKEVGKGTGLGLSQVYGTIRQAGGSVRLDSVEGRGTTVTLLLPCTASVAVGAAPERAGPPAPDAVARATVLVVDDDPDVRGFLAESLEVGGYRTIVAEDGYAGIAALERSRPDALIVDFAMPGMNGAQVARQARGRRPDLPIIFASGFADTAAMRDVPGDSPPFLRKPFQIDELQAVLGELLRARP